MKIEAGKFYRTRDGKKAGPAFSRNGRWRAYNDRTGEWPYTDDGKLCGHDDPDEEDLIADWVDEPTIEAPVRERMIREIVPGVYGRLFVGGENPNTFGPDRQVDIGLVERGATDKGSYDIAWCLTATELRAAAVTFVQLADALESAA